MPIVIGALGTVTKGLLKDLDVLEIGGRVETIQTTALLRTARILRRVLETWGDLLSLKLQWKPSANTDEKNSKGVNNNNNNNNMISECTKVAEEDYKNRNFLVGNVTHWELSKKMIFDHTTKLYIHNLESDLETETHTILLDLEIQTDHRISTRPSYS